MFSLFEGKPDHSLFDLQETRRLISELPGDDQHKALEDITFWLDSIKTTKGFHPEVRTAIILLLDETALPLHTELLHQYLSAPHLQDFKGVHQWQGSTLMPRRCPRRIWPRGRITNRSASSGWGDRQIRLEAKGKGG